MYFAVVSLFLVAVQTSQPFVGATLPTDVVEYEMPASCVEKGNTYCFDKGDKYPEETIEKLLKNITIVTVEGAPETPAIIGDREGNTYDDPDCPAISSNEPVYYIIDDSGKVRVVVQSEKLKQIYSLKWCQNEGRITKDTPHFLSSTTLDKFNIECVNSKMNVDFYVLNETKDLTKSWLEIVSIKDGIPVCCKCRLNKDSK